MKKKIITAAILAAGITIATGCSAEAATRKANGVYYDYMCVVTSDGKEWNLPDKPCKANPYMKKKTVYKCVKGKRIKTSVYMPIFRSGQKVRVTFDTNGTRKKSDDKIIAIKKRK